ncbi:class I adenylate-forming enzyme family protein [Desulforhopalus singaporensis]|uniref:Crotonobetaine/carnitine-CoA ligase n=1 Tax=Desulforhopalus singaporensis TaxID=91360 RepID=A0A1H0SCT7_9BACT|nr:class I adenylate-forming enzyme family protein [Desulforhopalus singaporensis]SDP39475.1 crotonobetaine/carnitine-CoA ligase [Desulforhopalus singaporensis]
MINSVLKNNIGTLLEKASETYGAKKVLHFHDDNVSFSYRQLNDMVNQYAVVLQSAGISKGDHLAVMLSNRPEFFLVWLALAKIGAVAVPLNIRYQVEDLEYVLNNSDAIGLVIEDEFAEVFRQARANTPNVKTVFTVGEKAADLGLDLPQLAADKPTDFNGPEVTVETLMSIQYTSGTTGFPKGCMLTHEYWLTTGFVGAEMVTEDDIFLCVEPFYYMDPPWELLMCIMKGMTMVAAKSYSPSRFMPLVRQYDITISWALLSYWIYKQPESPLDKAHKLRMLLSGAILKDVHKQFEERFNVPLREGYGMTEIGPGIVMPLEDSHMSGSGSVGKPTKFRSMKIVDDEGREVAQGEVGELWVSGAGLFKGYYRNPEATAAAFAGEWFRTGDLFRQDADGYYFIVGRKKDMIRRAGDNVAAAEVENVLMSHPKILSAAVVAVPDPDRREEVKAYVIVAQGESQQTIPPQEIIEFCKDRLADFKVPRYIEYKEVFPLTPTGKIRKPNLLLEKDNLTEGCYDRLSEKN